MKYKIKSLNNTHAKQTQNKECSETAQSQGYKKQNKSD